jgi:hypothetical protein
MTSSGRNYYPRVVRAENNMSLAISKTFLPATPGTEEGDDHLNISVVFTSVKSTLAALKQAASLASSLGARIRLLVPQQVPQPLPLENPPVLAEFNERRFQAIAGESHVETSVHVFLCRDRAQTLKSVLGPGSIVVIGGRKRPWWPTRDEVLARELRRADFEVIFTETE